MCTTVRSAFNCFALIGTRSAPHDQTNRSWCMPVNTLRACLQKRRMLGRRRGMSPHRGPRSHARRDTHSGVFHHQAAGRVDLQMGGSDQVHIGVRLAARHLVAAENAAFKKVDQAHLLEHHLDLEPVCARSHRDAALAVVVQMRHGFVHAFDGGDALRQAFVAPCKKLFSPRISERLAVCASMVVRWLLTVWPIKRCMHSAGVMCQPCASNMSAYVKIRVFNAFTSSLG